MTFVWKKLRSMASLATALLLGALIIFSGCKNPEGTESYVGRDFDPGNGNGIDISPPTEPILISFSGIASATKTKTLSWLASSDNNSLSHYEIALGTTGFGLGQSDLMAFTNIGNVTTYQIQDGVDNASINLSSNTLYYISLRAVDASDNVSTVASASFSYFEPSDFANLVLWLDATNLASLKQNAGCSVDVENNLDAINCILDLSGNNHNFISNSGSAIYTTNVINSNPVFVLSDGDRLETPDSGLINIGHRNVKSHYIVFRTDGDINTRQSLYKEGGGTNGTAFYIDSGNLYIGIWIEGSGNSSDRSWVSYPISANSNYIAGFSLDDSSDEFVVSVNGNSTSQAALGGQTLQSHSGDVIIGAHDNTIRLVDGSNVAINNNVANQGEHLMYDDALTNVERQTVEGYLACKWSMQSALPSSHPYKTNCP